MTKIPSRSDSLTVALAFLLAAVMPQTWRAEVYRKTDDKFRSELLHEAADKLDGQALERDRGIVRYYTDLLRVMADDRQSWEAS